VAITIRNARTARTPRERPAIVAMAVSLVLAVVKLLGHLVTGSTALLAAAVDSATDALVSGVNAWTVRFAGTPADAGHPFGHGKAEHLSALFQSLLLAAAAAFVLVTPFRGDRLLHPLPLRHPAIGIGIGVMSIIVPMLLSTFLRRAGKQTHSPALEADAAHYASDYLVNFGVVVAFVCDRSFDWRMADPVIAVVIAAAILRLAWRVGVVAISGLMDAGLAKDELELVRGVLGSAHPQVLGYHDLMTRRSGPNRFVQVHVELDAARTFRDAHRIVEEVRRDLERAIPNLIVTIHADPWPQAPEDAEPKPDPAALSTHP
jgi:ferrous-iron efflux pump FieF